MEAAYVAKNRTNRGASPRDFRRGSRNATEDVPYSVFRRGRRSRQLDSPTWGDEIGPMPDAFPGTTPAERHQELSPPGIDETAAAVVAGRRDEAGRPTAAARTALGELYERHAPSLLAFLASRVARSELEDVHQEVWLRAWQGLAREKFSGAFRGWLFAIARNYLIDRGRKKRPEPLAETADPPDTRSPPTEEPLLEAERKKILEQCLAKLEARAAEVVRARLAGDDYSDICPRLNLDAARAHKIWHVATRQLQECVQRALP